METALFLLPSFYILTVWDVLERSRGFVMNNLSISPSSSSSFIAAREQNVPAPGWEGPITGRVIYTDPCGGCRLPSNTGLRWAEEGERARDSLFAWERAREGEAWWRVNVSLARIGQPTGRRSGSWQCRKSPAAAGANAHTHPAIDRSTWSRTRSDHKHDVMLQVWATGVKIKARVALRNKRDQTRSYHRLFDLVVNGHHTGSRWAEREEKQSCWWCSIERSWSERRVAAGRGSLGRGRYLLSTRTDALSFPSTEDRNDIEKFLSWQTPRSIATV